MLLWILAQTETKHTLEWKTAFPAWAIAMIAMFLLVWVYFCYKRETATSSLLVKSSLGLLRAGILLAFLAILCEPVWHEETSKTRKSHLVFMVDSSLSMKNKDQYNDTETKELSAFFPSEKDRFLSEINRLDIAKKILSSSQRIKELEKECEVKWCKFSGDFTSVPSLEEIDADGQRTNIYNNLTGLISSFHGRTISAIYILSDGQHNTHTNPSEKEQALEQAITYSKEREIPIYTVGMGSLEKKRDIALATLEAPEIALLDDNVRFDLEIRHTGYQGQSIPVYIKWGDSVIAEKMVKIEHESLQKASLYHAFTVPDDYNITVMIPEQPGEFTIENNAKQHNIKIIQQKLRVLYLENLPRWEYRYLKNALVRDQTVLSNTWLFSADRDFPQEKSKLSPSISGVPIKKELEDIHCILLGDVSPSQLGKEFMTHLVDFVKEGGGVAFIAGTHSNPAEYMDTPLFPLLPIQLEERKEIENNALQRIRLTAEGKYHSIMRLIPNVEDNVQLWENERTGLPGFYWAFPISKGKPAATVLATNQLTGKPLMATQIYGKGRTFFTALDDSWRWRYLYGDRYFYRFWGQVIRHVAMGKLVTSNRQYYLRVDNTEYSIGEKVEITLRLRDPLKSGDRPKEMEVVYMEPNKEEKSKKLPSADNDPGTYQSSIIATQIGTYKVKFTPPEGKELEIFFNVVPPTAEAGNTELNEEDLKRLASKTKGEYLKVYELEASLKKLQPKKETIQESEREYPYWDNEGILLLIIGLFTAEWVLRKLFRML